jgi:hypothetical protein
MAPKHYPTPLSGGDKELGKARAMANILATQSAEMRAKGEAPIQQADKLPCESSNERMWSDGEPIDPSPTIDQSVNGGFPGWRSSARGARRRRRRPGGDGAPTDHLRARPREPAALPFLCSFRGSLRRSAWIKNDHGSIHLAILSTLLKKLGTTIA